MRVLIVAKTHMVGKFCVGALAKDTNKNIRLMKPGCKNQPITTKYEVGQVWDMDFSPSQEEKFPPHVEDVIVYHSEYLGRARDLKQTLQNRVQISSGGPDTLFHGMLNRSRGGSLYISEKNGIPEQSVAFWQPDEELILYTNARGRTRYSLKSHEMNLSYVGVADSIPEIPAGALLRVSLCRWWHPHDEPDAEKRCYLQLSGWFL
ncbi:MAG: hypothetical protein B6244_04480 [Candidatus Cloacimonetes bacterium 4572_55]|nr:MAG: hypothetical protein B6244_04480 [Candidatus Cloacimonetes bacterium 4572_55]